MSEQAARAQFRVARGAHCRKSMAMLPIPASVSRRQQPRPGSAAAAALLPGQAVSSSANSRPMQHSPASKSICSAGCALQSQAAFERYLASDEGRRAARIALIGSVVDAYLDERLAEEQLALTDRTLKDWTVSLDITHKLHEARQVSGLDIAQAEGQVRQAEADHAMRTRALAEARNALQHARRRGTAGRPSGRHRADGPADPDAAPRRTAFGPYREQARYPPGRA